MHLSIQLPNSLEGSEARCFRAKKMGFRVFKGKRSRRQRYTTGEDFPRFLEFQVEFDWTPPQKKRVEGQLVQIIFLKYFSVENSNKENWNWNHHLQMFFKHVPSRTTEFIEATGDLSVWCYQGFPFKTLKHTDLHDICLVQDGPLPVINGVITPINGLIIR